MELFGIYVPYKPLQLGETRALEMKRYIGMGEVENNKFELFVSIKSHFPIVTFSDGSEYILKWEDIIDLAIKSRKNHVSQHKAETGE